MLIDTNAPEVLALCNESERILLANLAHRLADVARLRRIPLRELRKARGLSAAALAALAGVSESAVHRYETRRRLPEPGPLDALAKALGVPVKSIALEVYTPHRRGRNKWGGA